MNKIISSTIVVYKQLVHLRFFLHARIEMNQTRQSISFRDISKFPFLPEPIILSHRNVSNFITTRFKIARQYDFSGGLRGLNPPPS